MTSSMREPVSMSAVATMVSAPASSVCRAAAKILARNFQRAGADAARHGIALGALVEGAAETGDGIEQDEDVAAALDQALGALDDELRQADVAGVFLVVGGGPELAAAGQELTEIGDFLGPLVDQDDHDEGVGGIDQHRVGDGLHEHGLAGSGRGDDEAALAVADRGHEIEDAGGKLVGAGLELDAAVGIDGGQFLEGELVAVQVDAALVDLLELDELGAAAVGDGNAGGAGRRRASRCA